MNSNQTLSSRITNPLVFAVASTTSPPIIRRNIEIRATVRMALRAVSFASVLCRRGLSTQDVNTHRNRLQVGRANAIPHTAEVINGKAIRDRADQQLVGVAMRWYIVACKPEEAVTSGALNGCPEPTSFSLVHLSPEPNFSIHASV